MTFRCPWRIAAVLAVLAVLALAAAARAEVKDAAELLPAQTLACVEVRQPERLAREITALVRGSELDDMPAVMARFREKLGDNMPFYFFNEAAVMSLLFSPEMINECGRVQGGVFAVTGVNKDGPEVVGVVLAGDSNLPTFYLRAMLTADFNVRSVAEVEGVRIYRERRQIYHPALPGQPPPMPTWEDSGPFMALLPSTVVLGSSAQGVKDVIVRFKGKSSEPSLASVASYKEAAKQRDKPGLFAYTDLAALAQRMDEAGKDLGPMERKWRVVKAAVNPKAVRGAVASLTLQNGVVELKAHVDLDPKESSPLVELLTAKPASPDLLHFTPRDGLLTLSLNLNDGEKRWGKLMEMFDSLDKPEAGEAERPAPSKMLKELEDRVKLNVAKDVLGRLTGAAVVLDAPLTTTMSYMEAPRPGGPPPVRAYDGSGVAAVRASEPAGVAGDRRRRRQVPGGAGRAEVGRAGDGRGLGADPPGRGRPVDQHRGGGRHGKPVRGERPLHGAGGGVRGDRPGSQGGRRGAGGRRQKGGPAGRGENGRRRQEPGRPSGRRRLFPR